MKSADESGSLNSRPATEPAELLAECRKRIVEREGIAMFIALQDLRPDARAVTSSSDVLTVESQRLAALFDHYRDGLENTRATRDPDDDPTGASSLIDILVTLSDQHLRAREGGEDGRT